MLGPVYKKGGYPPRRHRLRPGRHEAQPELAAGFRISSIPTLMAVRDRTVLCTEPGGLSPQALEELIGKIRAAEMDDVRRQATAGTMERS
ncbi:thioredoxin family protein [Streptomyces mirabilis]|jgi:thioredoxin 1|uniref:Thioredoxin n=1 Tax=Streptomyces mirabilis TaxID=68239 RepID=A0A1I2UAF9_9ACTN|nr:hypothetical protein [Streptomyces mirabilis]SFG74124.1 thioredoxin [Streptomyces mirabilis]